MMNHKIISNLNVFHVDKKGSLKHYSSTFKYHFFNVGLAGFIQLLLALRLLLRRVRLLLLGLQLGTSKTKLSGRAFDTLCTLY